MNPPENKQNYYILGSRGFLGKNLKKYLLSKNQFVYDDIQLNITNYDDICELIRRNQIDVLFNAAGISDYTSCEKDPIDSFDVNTTGVLNILNSIHKYSPATRFINFGSIKEFDDTSWYSQTKRIARDLVSYYRETKGIWAIQLFLPQIVGPGQSDRFVIGKIVKFLKELKELKTNPKSAPGGPTLQLGNINSNLKLLYIDNSCELIIKSSNFKNPQDYLLDGIDISVKDLLIQAFSAANIINWEDFIEIDEKLFRPRALENYIELVGTKLKSRDTIDNILNKLLNEN